MSVRSAGGRHPEPSARLRILLIEDNPADAFLVREHLEEDPDFRCEVCHVTSLQEAERTLASYEPDVALTDLSLPDSHGLETFLTLQSWDHGFPIVILSGDTDKHLAMEAVRRGAQDYLPKNELTALLLTRMLGYAVERSRADRDIAANERRWRAMVQGSSDVVALVDTDLRPIYVSDSIRRISGYQPEHLLNENLLDYVHLDDRATIERALGETVAGEQGPHVQFRFRSHTGTWEWREAVATNLLNDPDVKAIVVNVRDIQERKQAEAETGRQKRILQAAIDSLPGIFYLFDDTPRLVLWNRNLEEVTGRTAEALALVHPADLVAEREDIRDAVRRVFEEGSATVEGHVLGGAGEEIPYFFTGQKFVLDGKPFAVGMGLDMTERRDAQRHVEFQASLLAQVKSAVIATDNQGLVTYWNQFAEELYGWTRDEALGRSVVSLNVPEHVIEQVEQILANVVAEGRWEGEFPVQHKDGSVFPAWTTLATIQTGGESTGFLGVSTDISERKRAEEERKSLLRELGERVKELRLLHEVSLILEQEDAELSAILERLVTIMPTAWRYPSETAASIRYRHDGREIRAHTRGFHESHWMQQAEFATNSTGQGSVQISYLGDPPASSGPFLEEEQALIESVAQMLRAYLERRHAIEQNEALTKDLSSQVSRLGALQKISESILSSSDLDQTLGVIVEQAIRELGCDAADVLTFDAATQTLTYAAGAGFQTRLPKQTLLRLGEGMAGKAALSRKPLRITDASAPEVTASPPGLLEQEHVVSYYAVPLISKGQLQGVLGSFHRRAHDFGEAWCSVASDIARQAAIAIDNARLLEDLQRSNVELQLSYDRTIEGWARALDLKDEETAGHSQRVTRVTIELAKRLGIVGEELGNIRRGALLHDIGKMGVPDRILLKPGKLDEDEWEIMKRHTTYARDFLAGIPFLERALDIPYAHHEKWDGSGYPRGLREASIPLAARIFAVVDVFDALTNDRPYRSAWGREEARAYIDGQVGKHFDPRVVEAFRELLDDPDQLSDPPLA